MKEKITELVCEYETLKHFHITLSKWILFPCLLSFLSSFVMIFLTENPSNVYINIMAIAFIFSLITMGVTVLSFLKKKDSISKDLADLLKTQVISLCNECGLLYRIDEYYIYILNYTRGNADLLLDWYHDYYLEMRPLFPDYEIQVILELNTASGIKVQADLE